MKALVISDDDKSLGVIDSILQTNGIDSINYKWLIKALDNVEEIRPDLIIINVLDYPRHWKTLAQFVRSTFEDSIKILLYVPESFSSDEYKKAAELGIESCSSSFDDFNGYINEQENKLKEKYNVNTIYTPKGVEIKKTITYDDKIDSNEKIYRDLENIYYMFIKMVLILSSQDLF